jgi:hypothetical protein
MSIAKSIQKSKGLDRPCDLQVVEVARISEHPTYEEVNVVSPTHRSHLPPGRYMW